LFYKGFTAIRKFLTMPATLCYTMYIMSNNTTTLENLGDEVAELTIQSICMELSSDGIRTLSRYTGANGLTIKETAEELLVNEWFAALPDGPQ